MRQIIVGGGSQNALNTAATEYNTVYGREGNTWLATETSRRQIVPGNGIGHSFKVILSAAPGGGGAYVFTILKTGAATALTVTITDPATSAEITTATESFTAGDRWSIECAPSGSPTATPTAQWELIVEDTDNINRCWITGGHQNTLNTLVTELNNLAGGNLWQTLAPGLRTYTAPTPLSGRFINFFVRLNGSPGAGNSYTIVVRQGGASSHSVTIADTATNGSDTTSSQVAAGIPMAIRCTPAGTPTARQVQWGLCFQPDDPYFQPVFTYCPAVTDTYNSLFDAGQTWGATESVFRKRVKRGLIKNLYVDLGAAPGGAGDSRTFTIYKNGSATALAVTLTGAVATGNDLNNILEVQDDDELSLHHVAGGSPAGSDVGVSFAYMSYEPHMYSAREGNMGN